MTFLSLKLYLQYVTVMFGPGWSVVENCAQGGGHMALSDWLHANNLGQYTAALLDEGYDELAILKGTHLACMRHPAWHAYVCHK